MNFSAQRRAGPVILATLVAFGGWGAGTARAQAPATFDGSSGFGGMAMPNFPPSGMWAEVLSVTPKWMVLQTAGGQQLPVSFEAVGLFVMRWPTAPGLLAPNSLLEVTGLDLASSRVMADHVDVYEGAARNLVSPVSQVLIGFNRILTQFDIDQMNTYGVNYPLLPGEAYMPRRRHIVGPVASIAPLAIATPGNTAAMVVPSSGGMSMTQVSLGSSSFVRPGDIVWCQPTGGNPRTLILGRLLVYKSMPLNQFAP